MPYKITESELQQVSNALIAYYEKAWEQGIKDLFSTQRGMVHVYWDKTCDTYAALTKTSNEKFGITLKAELKKEFDKLTANPALLEGKLLPYALYALNKLADHIPVASSVIKAAINYGGEILQEELHRQAVHTADTIAGADYSTIPFTSDKEALDSVKSSLEQYLLCCNFIKTIPDEIRSFDDLVTFPESIFLIQKSSSSINIQLYKLRNYFNLMISRLEKTQDAVKESLARLRNDYPKCISSLLDECYDNAFKSGKEDLTKGQYTFPRRPNPYNPSTKGGATQLAEFIARATVQGYYDAGHDFRSLSLHDRISVALDIYQKNQGMLTRQSNDSVAAVKELTRLCAKRDDSAIETLMEFIMGWGARSRPSGYSAQPLNQSGRLYGILSKAITKPGYVTLSDLS